MFEPIQRGGLLPEYLAYWEAGYKQAPVTAKHHRRAKYARSTAWTEGLAIVALFEFLRGDGCCEDCGETCDDVDGVEGGRCCRCLAAFDSELCTPCATRSEEGDGPRRPTAERGGGLGVFPPGPTDLLGWLGWLEQGGPAPSLRRDADGRDDRVDKLRLLGNGVVPLQFAHALRELLRRVVAPRDA